MVTGGGFIGVETAENLHRRGVQVSLVELADQVLAPLDAEMATLVHAELTANGVGLTLGAGLSRVLTRLVELTKGQSLPADLVIIAVGVRPDTALGLDFWLYGRTAIQLNAFHQRLERMQRFLAANSVSAGLTGQNRGAALAELVARPFPLPAGEFDPSARLAALHALRHAGQLSHRDLAVLSRDPDEQVHKTAQNTSARPPRNRTCGFPRASARASL